MSEDSAIKLSLIQDIGQKVDEIKKNQELSLVLEGKLAREAISGMFSNSLAAVLVYLHIPDFNQTSLVAELNSRYTKYNVKVSQQAISAMLSKMREQGFLLPSRKPAYQPAWRKFLLKKYLRQQLPAALRPKLKKELDRLDLA